MTHNGRKNANEVLALALAIGKSLREAATESGISERTAGRRWADMAFRQRVLELRSELVSQAVGRLTDASTAAADRLKQLLNAESENVALGAARAVLELGRTLRESGELEARLVELERRLAAQEQTKEKK